MNPIPVIIFVCAIALFAVYKARQHRQREIAANEMAWATIKNIAKELTQQQLTDKQLVNAEISAIKKAFVEGYHANQGGKKVDAATADLTKQNQALADDLQPLYRQLLLVEKEASANDVLLVILHFAFSTGGLRMMEAQGRKKVAQRQQQMLTQRRQQLQHKADSNTPE
ncbi:hypothetical protein [Ferrimonas lipolytica]|uniref:Uncharacterized protein n=1 Tax=Ferrimonas lipolytica TaxID=2724191 RepID=A0A6H1UHK1_9GAMM|nr:hypothetical protein [Ferrimonas lipolytica]QIZ77696.1 hypothetical protein HER31_12785 [Ferrimonas lipolytica]